MFRLNENNFIGSEDDMVKKFISHFENIPLLFGDNRISGEYFEQIRVPNIGRISDLIINCHDSRLINIEFKLHDWNCVLSQAKDHLGWCDYSYICVPINSLRVFPRDFFDGIMENKIGLIVGSNDTFLEILKAKHNTYKSGKSKSLRTFVLNKLKKIKQKESQLKLDLNIKNRNAF